MLVRAAEPVAGEGSMVRRRGLRPPVRPGAVAGGPGKLCHALAIDRTFDGGSLRRRELQLTEGGPVGTSDVVRGPRVGVDYAGEAASWPLRFAVAGNRHVSRPWRWIESAR